MSSNIFANNNITMLSSYRKPMKNPILVELLEHWERLRAGRIAPMRSEIDPREIENALEHAFILERPEAGEARFRIAGMRLCEIMGMEIRTMPASAIIAPEARAEFNVILDTLFDMPEIVELTLQSDLSGGAVLSADMLLLPMKNDKGEISRILGCLVTSGATPCPPHRFRIKARKVTRIIASDYTPRKPRVTGFAEETQVYVPMPVAGPTIDQTPAEEKDYLRLVVSDD